MDELTFFLSYGIITAILFFIFCYRFGKGSIFRVDIYAISISILLSAFNVFGLATYIILYFTGVLDDF